MRNSRFNPLWRLKKSVSADEVIQITFDLRISGYRQRYYFDKILNIRRFRTND